MHINFDLSTIGIFLYILFPFCGVFEGLGELGQIFLFPLSADDGLDIEQDWPDLLPQLSVHQAMLAQS